LLQMSRSHRVFWNPFSKCLFIRFSILHFHYFLFMKV
jgi:hypothetical protein